jgi:hypothetical protein
MRRADRVRGLTRGINAGHKRRRKMALAFILDQTQTCAKCAFQALAINAENKRTALNGW